ncbi:MAG TPA: LysE family translocator [Anaerolineales bacterium]|nr:LysE family translocator [Anaerolineales bacterium]HRF47954.1 LysE family translocator [Anaerolineales bacterium]
MPPHLLAFLAVAVPVVLAPGPSLIAIVARGIAQGRRAGVVFALADSLGLVVQVLAIAAGLAALLQTSALAFRIVQYTGAAYLVYLGIQLWRSSGQPVFDGHAPGGESRATLTLFRQGFIVGVSNPKAGLFLLAFLPQFVAPGAGPEALQILMYGLVFTSLTITYGSLMGAFAGQLGAWLRTQVTLQRWIQRLAAVTFVGLGVRLALTERA